VPLLPPSVLLSSLASQAAANKLSFSFVASITVNGVVPEKFDAVKLSHMVDAEYGNQGLDFKFVAREGFGWTNASFQVGVSFLTYGSFSPSSPQVVLFVSSTGS
jgi:alpha,alpha-trehalase